MENAKNTKGMPTAIVMKSVKGKGVSYMENNAGWHGKAPNDDEYKIAMDDLAKIDEQLNALNLSSIGYTEQTSSTLPSI